MSEPSPFDVCLQTDFSTSLHSQHPSPCSAWRRSPRQSRFGLPRCRCTEGGHEPERGAGVVKRGGTGGNPGAARRLGLAPPAAGAGFCEPYPLGQRGYKSPALYKLKKYRKMRSKALSPPGRGGRAGARGSGGRAAPGAPGTPARPRRTPRPRSPTRAWECNGPGGLIGVPAPPPQESPAARSCPGRPRGEQHPPRPASGPLAPTPAQPQVDPSACTHGATETLLPPTRSLGEKKQNKTKSTTKKTKKGAAKELPVALAPSSRRFVRAAVAHLYAVWIQLGVCI